MDLGTLAEWFTVGATLLATAVAAVASTVAYGAYKRESSRDHQSQAALVHAWLVTDVEEGGLLLAVANGGTAPVFEVRARCAIDGKQRAAPSRAGVWYILPPGFFVSELKNGRWEFPNPIADVSGYRPFARSERFLVTSLEFTDARGTAWVRGRTTGLVERSQTPSTAEDGAAPGPGPGWRTGRA